MATPRRQRGSNMGYSGYRSTSSEDDALREARRFSGSYDPDEEDEDDDFDDFDEDDDFDFDEDDDQGLDLIGSSYKDDDLSRYHRIPVEEDNDVDLDSLYPPSSYGSGTPSSYVPKQGKSYSSSSDSEEIIL